MNLKFFKHINIESWYFRVALQENVTETKPMIA